MTCVPLNVYHFMVLYNYTRLGSLTLKIKYLMKNTTINNYVKDGILHLNVMAQF